MKRLRERWVDPAEAFSEPLVDRREQPARVVSLSVALPQSGQAGRRAELERLRLLAARDRHRFLQRRLGSRHVGS